MAAYAHESITVSSTAIGFTAAKLALAISLYGRDVQKVLVTVESYPVRFTVDGTTPTSSVGHLLNVGDIYTCDGEDVFKFRAIRTTSDATIMCTYYIRGAE